MLTVQKSKLIRLMTYDHFMTYDRQTIDSAGVFLNGELERLDPTLNMPLANVTWSRDIQLREDVSIADELASFTNSSFAAAGGPSPNGKSWIGKDATAIQGLALDIGKTGQNLYLWGRELGWTLPELYSAQQVGRPIDTQKFDAMQLLHQMDTDEMVYIGDGQLSETGLVNSTAKVGTTGNAVTGSWTSATAMEISNDINTLITSVWQASGFAICPGSLRLPPLKFSLLVDQIVSTAGNISILEYVRKNNTYTAQTGNLLDIQPLKWLTGIGAGDTDRIMVYTNDKKFVRFPMVPLQRTPLEYRGINQLTTYFGRLGVVEFVYGETVGYADNI